MIKQSVDTARTYALVGFIFYFIASIVGIVGSLMMSIWAPHMMWFPRRVMFFPLGFSVIGIIFTVWAWITLQHIEAGKYSEGCTYSLVLGILGLFFAWLIGGIFFLLAYGKLGEAATSPAPQRFCIYCGRQLPPDAKHCPHCGKELPP